MSGAAFGKSYAFRGATEVDSSSNESSLSYGEALRLILDRCIALIVLGQKHLGNSWLPTYFKELHQATIVFQDHMTKAYETEKDSIARATAQEHNLMTSLVRASQHSVEEKQGKHMGTLQDGLTEEEIYGNIFVFNFAGHDATSNSLALAISLLATQPKVQDWISEEINTVLAGVSSEDSSYEQAFTRLKRCLAVTYETVRLYTAVAIAKSTGPSPQSLKIAGETVMLPKNTMVIPNYSALHTHPRYWGDDSLEFKPSCWVVSEPNDNATESIFDAERFKKLPKTNSPFVGWSGGARNCPGRKFSQVEFVRVLVALFRDHKVKPVTEAGENDDMARTRLAEQIKWDTGMRLLLQMLHPERAVLQWSKR